MNTILHVINKPSLRCQPVSQLQTLTSPGDGLLFIEDGVYNAVVTATNRAVMALVKADVYVLLPDLQARGFAPAQLIESIHCVNYSEFVDLTLAYNLVWSR